MGRRVLHSCGAVGRRRVYSRSDICYSRSTASHPLPFAPLRLCVTFFFVFIRVHSRLSFAKRPQNLEYPGLLKRGRVIGGRTRVGAELPRTDADGLTAGDRHLRVERLFV